MKTMANYLIIMLSVLLFIFRLIVLFTTTMGMEFVIQSSNVNFEIAYILVMLFSIIFISKNKLWGAILYLVSSLIYLGPTLFHQFMGMSNTSITVQSATEMVISVICIVVPVFAFFIIAFAKQQEKSPIDKKTDFFYKTDAYDRKYDERADKNNYRTL